MGDVGSGGHGRRRGERREGEERLGHKVSCR
jgi:hypothetical protein